MCIHPWDASSHHLIIPKKFLTYQHEVRLPPVSLKIIQTERIPDDPVAVEEQPSILHTPLREECCGSPVFACGPVPVYISRHTLPVAASAVRRPPRATS